MRGLLSSLLLPTALERQGGAGEWLYADRHAAPTCADWLSSIIPRSRAVFTVVVDDCSTGMSCMVTFSTWCCPANASLNAIKLSYHRDSVCHPSLCQSKSFKVTNVGTDWKPTLYDFWLVNNTNLEVTLQYCPVLCSTWQGVPLVLSVTARHSGGPPFRGSWS